MSEDGEEKSSFVSGVPQAPSPTFTPGPWVRLPQHGAGPMIVREIETGRQMQPTALRLICHMLQRGDTLQEDKANASLIAAAPELFEAVRKAIQLADIASDWNLPEVEIDGKMVSTNKLGAEFTAALSKAKA